MQARSMLSRSVCLSVCPSVCHVRGSHTFLGIIKIITLTVTGFSTRWPSQWLHFLKKSPKWLCYKSSLTHQKCTKSHLQRSRFQKNFPGGKTPDPAFEGPLRGGGGGGEGRRKGRGGEGTWRGPESGLPRGPRWLSSAGGPALRYTTCSIMW